MTMTDNAFAFFDACETGKGWAVCQAWCHDDASFSSQSVAALNEVTTLEAYVEWMKKLLVPLPDGRYTLKSFAADEARSTVVATAVFEGTHTVAVGDGAPTGNTVAADYAYVMEFDGTKIKHMTKIWNDAHSLKQLGWG